MEKLDDLLEGAQRALTSLLKLVGHPNADDVIEDAAIQRFEYTTEVMWKATQRLLIELGTPVGSPKTAIRHARLVGVLSEEDTIAALDLIDLRNLTTHTYNETLARGIYPRLPEIAALFERWLSGIKAHRNDASA